MTYEEAVAKVFDWQYRNTGSYFNTIILAFRKADAENYAKLASVYPALAAALRDWEAAGDYGNDLFRAHGLSPTDGMLV